MAFLALFFFQTGQYKGWLSPVSSLILTHIPMKGRDKKALQFGKEFSKCKPESRALQMQTQESECRFSAGLQNGTERREGEQLGKARLKGFNGSVV